MSITSGIHRSIQRSSDRSSVDNRHSKHALATETGLEKSLKSGGDLTKLYEQNVLDSAASDFLSEAQADPENLTNALHQAFGDKASAAQINQLAASIISGNIPMPESVEFVNAGALGAGVSGVYASENGGSILLDATLLMILPNSNVYLLKS